MGLNLSNFLLSKSKNKRMLEYQDLDHIDGVSISSVCADLYKDTRDDLVMFYFRDGVSHASVYTQSKIISENIKWNLNQKSKKIYSLLVNARNANCFTGRQGYKSLERIAELLCQKLNEKQIEDELQKAKSQCDEIMNTSGNNIKEQMALALEDSKIATTQLINEAEGRLKELRDGSEAAIEKISEELASEIISKISRGK